ncbi:membrane-bound lytic murein transglycosylase MltF [Saccharospirillum salsuginis]|uniref:Membrane-bound lytic murein transglycosylase F n=1 Tax=Saccharospirillum salsuginis TaxID=418750 RepID=A0A918KMX9_9GAMM|nr:membrane-bound lytic murein transglycosylase MltF [Saccharospirillum salsuginis]GGX69712.1 membrane-bound lytic murein transglycosylase F [Saccharospirillum salsuginis]
MYWRNPLHIGLRVLLTTLLLAGLGLVVAQGFEWHSHWDRIRDRGVLTVALRESEGVYWPTDQRYSGLEMELLQKLGERLNLRVQLFSVTETQDLYRALASGAVDMALPGTTTGYNSTAFMPGLPYLMSDVGLVRSMAARKPELERQHIALLDPVNHDWLARRLASRHPGLTFEGLTGAPTAELMTRIELDELDMALMDERDFRVQRPFFPDQRFDTLTDQPRPVSPLFRQSRDRSLLNRVNDVLRELRASGQLERLRDRHLGHTGDFDYVGTLTFERHMQSRLPDFLDLFKAEAEATGMDWRLLAAVAYQESHWRARAVSPTGVKGIMMVTLTTAREMGIDNRLDPAQSIRAGSRYLDGLRERMPERITEPDRTWMALAAYNVGSGHLEDARIITESQGDDPDAWIDVRSHLPKLALKAWYPWTKHGYARGHEPVVYVANIRRYYNLLRRAFPDEIRDEREGESLDQLPFPGLPVTPGL